MGTYDQSPPQTPDWMRPPPPPPPVIYIAPTAPPPDTSAATLYARWDPFHQTTFLVTAGPPCLPPAAPPPVSLNPPPAPVFSVWCGGAHPQARRQ
jgi:hypothetical protein